LRINVEKKEERERVALSLLRNTLALAAAHGFASLGLREVARAAGIAPTSFYRHFADMEELGLELISNLVGQLVLELTAPEENGAPAAVETIVTRTLSAAATDPELFRFVLAERVGSIVSFRRALRERLGVLSSAIRGSVPEAPHAEQADALVILLLEAAGELLERGAEHVPALRARLARQARALLSTAPPARGRR
jgi:AcrR family transcriptional regulator